MRYIIQVNKNTRQIISPYASYPPEIAQTYQTLLEQDSIASELYQYYKKWLRFYLDFCHKYSFDSVSKYRFPAFNKKLMEKNQSEVLRRQAHHAVSLYFQIPSMHNKSNLSHKEYPAQNTTNSTAVAPLDTAVSTNPTTHPKHSRTQYQSSASQTTPSRSRRETSLFEKGA